jgi:hypothetical protein
MSKFHFDLSFKLSQGEVHWNFPKGRCIETFPRGGALKLSQEEVHDFSGEVQKFAGEVRTSPQNPALGSAKNVPPLWLIVIKKLKIYLIQIKFIERSMSNLNFDVCLAHFYKILVEI